MVIKSISATATETTPENRTATTSETTSAPETTTKTETLTCIFASIRALLS